MPMTVESGYTVAGRIAEILRANGVQNPQTPRPDFPCSLEYLIENALRQLGLDRGRKRVYVDCGGKPYEGFTYPKSRI